MPLNLGDQHISLPEAAELTQRFRQSNPVSAIKAHLFTKEIVMEILNQPGCEGLRIYHGIDANNEAVVVLTGADIDKNDMYNGTLAERAERCPLICSSPNPLN